MVNFCNHGTKLGLGMQKPFVWSKPINNLKDHYVHSFLTANQMLAKVLWTNQIA